MATGSCCSHCCRTGRNPGQWTGNILLAETHMEGLSHSSCDPACHVHLKLCRDHGYYRGTLGYLLPGAITSCIYGQKEETNLDFLAFGLIEEAP